MAKKPKSLVGPLRASDTRLRKVKSTTTEVNPNAKPKVFVLRCGTANQLGPAKEFTTDEAMKKAAGEFFKEAIPWCQRHENAGVERIHDAIGRIGAVPELVQLDQPHRVECLVDSHYQVIRVVEMRKIKAPPKPEQQTIIKQEDHVRRDHH